MAVTYGFYDSLNHDRLYNAQQMSAIFDGIINDGVFMSVGNQFHTVAGTGMQVIVKSGRAWFDSTWTLNDAEYPLSIDAADVLLTRIDAVVLEVNSEVATRANTIKVIKGTPASTPAKPTLTNTATIHQHALAYVTVAKNITAITNSMIEIVVGKTETPYVTAILQTTDITDLYNQWEDYFQTWFDTVRSTLDGDVALNLQNQITTLRREMLKPTTPPVIGLPSSATPDDMFQALAKTGNLHVWRKTANNAADVPAGYTLEAAQSNLHVPTAGESIDFVFSASITVGDDGTVSQPSSNYKSVYATNTYVSVLQSLLAGKFFKTRSLYAPGIEGVWYCPSNLTVSVSDNDIILSQAQKVNAHGIIPAGTTTTYPVSTLPNAYQEGSNAGITIEYLGNLGDKARVQVVSYVGTGTSGSNNPVSITFDFVPKTIWVIGNGYSYESEIHLMHGDASKNSGNVYYFAFSRISWESKTVSWYNTRSDGYQASALQANTLGETYKVLAIG